jgi:hypothetical protein
MFEWRSVKSNHPISSATRFPVIHCLDADAATDGDIGFSAFAPDFGMGVPRIAGTQPGRDAT